MDRLSQESLVVTQMRNGIRSDHSRWAFTPPAIIFRLRATQIKPRTVDWPSRQAFDRRECPFYRNSPAQNIRWLCFVTELPV
jgi:hypothetical protein